jgi:predicted esterase
MREYTLPVYRTARYALLGDPSGPIDEVWLACHGYGQLAPFFLRPFRAVESPRRLIVAPEGLSRFYLENDAGAHHRVGASWMTRAMREAEIDDYVRFLDAVYADVLTRAGTVRARLTAFGFSQGGATVTRWLAHSPMLGRPPAERLILWGSALPHDLDLGTHAGWLKQARLTLVTGDGDEYATPERIAAQTQALDEHGIACEAVGFRGGHRVDEDTLRGLIGGAGGGS